MFSPSDKILQMTKLIVASADGIDIQRSQEREGLRRTDTDGDVLEGLERGRQGGDLHLLRDGDGADDRERELGRRRPFAVGVEARDDDVAGLRARDGEDGRGQRAGKVEARQVEALGRARGRYGAKRLGERQCGEVERVARELGRDHIGLGVGGEALHQHRGRLRVLLAEKNPSIGETCKDITYRQREPAILEALVSSDGLESIHNVWRSELVESVGGLDTGGALFDRGS